MLRALLSLLFTSFAAGSVAGCFSGAGAEPDCDYDFELSLWTPPPEADIIGLEARYALGTRAKVRLQGDAPVSVESSDTDVVWIEGVAPEEATLSFVGEGTATLTASNALAEVAYEVEVLPHATFLVLLAEQGFVPLAPLYGQAILGGPQYILVLYLDAEGTRLFGGDLAEVAFSSGLQPCEAPLRSEDRHCLTSPSAGTHVVTVRVGEEERSVSYETVPEAEIVDIELLQPDENDLSPGTWTQIDVVGITEDGRHVASVHPQFITAQNIYVGYLAYQYDPTAPPTPVEVWALEHVRQAELRGTPSDKTAVSCESEDESGAPLPAAASLLGLVVAIRGSSRRLA